MIQKSTIRRLGRTAGENTATGAIQRLEQACANFEQRNDYEAGDDQIFRNAAFDAFREAIKNINQENAA